MLQRALTDGVMSSASVESSWELLGGSIASQAASALVVPRRQCLPHGAMVRMSGGKNVLVQDCKGQRLEGDVQVSVATVHPCELEDFTTVSVLLGISGTVATFTVTAHHPVPAQRGEVSQVYDARQLREGDQVDILDEDGVRTQCELYGVPVTTTKALPVVQVSVEPEGPLFLKADGVASSVYLVVGS